MAAALTEDDFSDGADVSEGRAEELEVAVREGMSEDETAVVVGSAEGVGVNGAAVATAPTPDRIAVDAC